MEGFLAFRIPSWVRRLITRLAAIVPAILVIANRGGSGVNDLLVLSQVVLALQLPFAMFPLLHLTGRCDVMDGRPVGWVLGLSGWSAAFFITAMDVYGLPAAIRDAAVIVAGR